MNAVGTSRTPAVTASQTHTEQLAEAAAAAASASELRNKQKSRRKKENSPQQSGEEPLDAARRCACALTGRGMLGLVVLYGVVPHRSMVRLKLHLPELHQTRA